MAQITTRYRIQASDETTATLQRIEKQAKKLNEGFSTIGKTVAGAFAVDKIVDFANEAVKAFAEKEKSLLRFDAVLKNIGADTRLNEVFGNLANELEALGIGVDDGKVLDLASQYLALGRTAPEVQKLIKVGANLSALTGNDLTTSVSMLTKADEGQIKTLRMLIPELKTLTDEQIKNGDAVDIVAKKTEGLAEKIGNGTAGSIERLANSWQNLLEVFGKNIAVSPWIGKLTEGLDRLATTIDNVSGVNKAVQDVQNNTADQYSVETLEKELALRKALQKYLLENVATKNYTRDGEFNQLEKIAGLKSNLIFGSSLDDVKEANAELQKQIASYERSLARLHKAERDKQKEVKVQTAVSIAPKINIEETKKTIQKAIELGLEKFEPSMLLNPNYGTLVDTQYNDASIEEMKKQADEKKKAEQAKFESDINSNISYVSNYFSTLSSSIGGFYSLWMNLEDQKNKSILAGFDKQLSELDKTYSAQIKAKADLGEETTALEDEMAKKKDAIEREKARKADEIGRKTFEANKLNTMASITSQTALATVSALGSFPFGPWNIALASMVGALGLAQLSLAGNASYTPQAATGAFVPRKQGGSEVIVGEGNNDEWIFNTPQLKKIVDGASSSPVYQVNVSGNVVGIPEIAKAISDEMNRRKDLNRV